MWVMSPCTILVLRQLPNILTLLTVDYNSASFSSLGTVFELFVCDDTLDSGVFKVACAGPLILVVEISSTEACFVGDAVIVATGNSTNSLTFCFVSPANFVNDLSGFVCCAGGSPKDGRASFI